LIASVNPATGETVRVFSPLTPVELEARLALEYRAFQIHRQTKFSQRAEQMSAAASVLEAEKDRFANIITLERGKPLEASLEEVEKVRGRLPLFR
jgi:succinate-semialdehyde dehydrogenase/glutarate-semialdehyde dehydrogenase